MQTRILLFCLLTIPAAMQTSAQSLLTNAHDYALFLKAVARGEGLKPGTHRMMLTPATAADWFHHKPSEATAHISWGLGVGLQDDNPSFSYKDPDPAPAQRIRPPAHRRKKTAGCRYPRQTPVSHGAADRKLPDHKSSVGKPGEKPAIGVTANVHSP